MGLKKKVRRQLDQMIEEILISNEEEIDAILAREGIVELILDLGDGEMVPLGIWEREDLIEAALCAHVRPAVFYFRQVPMNQSS